MAAPLWAQALKGVADLGTVVGNGLAFGYGNNLKNSAFWAGNGLASAAGLTDYRPLKDYLDLSQDELSSARKGAGVVGQIAEPVADVVGGLGGVSAAMKLGAAAKTAPALAAKVYASPIGKALGLGAVGLGGETSIADLLGSGKSGQSSATTGAQPGSKQTGPAAAAANDPYNEANWSPAKKHFVDTMSSIPLNQLQQMLTIENIGSRPQMPRDIAFQRLTGMLQQQYANDAQADPAKARAAYIQNMTSLLAPAGVPYMSVDGNQ